MIKFAIFAFLAIALVGMAGAQSLNWREMADLPQPVAGFMGGVIDGHVLIVGGSSWDHGKKQWNRSVQSFDPRTNQWSQMSPMPEPRSDAASVTIGNDLYVFGGDNSTGVLRDALVFHDGKWSAVPGAELPEPRKYANAVVERGAVYLLGGMPTSGDYKSVTNTLWRWRPGDKGWEVLPALPGPGRINHAMAEIGGKIFVFGGATTGPKDVQNLDDAYSYDPAHKHWTRLPDLSVANRSWWAIGIGDRALVLAGYTNDYARAVYWYSPGKGLESAGELPHGLADAKFYRVGDLVIGSGGEAGPGVRGKWTMEAKIPNITSGKHSR